VHLSHTVKHLDFLPSRVLPLRALVIALSPLLDKRIINAAVDLAVRGFDLIVIALAPIEPTRRALRGSRLDEAACRLWAIEWRLTV
jgi:hypothetical protein